MIRPSNYLILDGGEAGICNLHIRFTWVRVVVLMVIGISGNETN